MAGKILPWIPRGKLLVQFSRSSGPGGQGVNRTESKVEIRFNLAEADWLSSFVKSRLRTLYSNSINVADELVVTSQESRSQKDNYSHCLEKLSAMISAALKREKKRLATAPTRSSIRDRLNSKSKRSMIKKTRKFRDADED